MSIDDAAKLLVKKILYRTPLASVIAHPYVYNFSPAQLSFFCQCIDATRELRGAIVEVGCFLGHTTIFLNKHMDFSEIEKPYYALDTFDGFLGEDIDHEVKTRGKRKADIAASFKGNSKYFFDKHMVLNSITRVLSIQTDASTFEFSRTGRISFALIDVDLYHPVKVALQRIYGQLEPGGIVVVDDCQSNNPFDGALQAYNEFVAEHALVPRVAHQKLGVIQKPKTLYGENSPRIGPGNVS
jgi:O-methyltransferase